jgi:hypothetical protein
VQIILATGPEPPAGIKDLVHYRNLGMLWP